MIDFNNNYLLTFGVLNVEACHQWWPQHRQSTGIALYSHIHKRALAHSLQVLRLFQRCLGVPVIQYMYAFQWFLVLIFHLILIFRNIFSMPYLNPIYAPHEHCLCSVYVCEMSPFAEESTHRALRWLLRCSTPRHFH